MRNKCWFVAHDTAILAFLACDVEEEWWGRGIFLGCFFLWPENLHCGHQEGNCCHQQDEWYLPQSSFYFVNGQKQKRSEHSYWLHLPPDKKSDTWYKYIHTHTDKDLVGKIYVDRMCTRNVCIVTKPKFLQFSKSIRKVWFLHIQLFLCQPYAKRFSIIYFSDREIHWKAQDSFLTSLWDLLSNKQVQFPNINKNKTYRMLCILSCCIDNSKIIKNIKILDGKRWSICFFCKPTN